MKILHVVDEFTRESLSDVVGHSIDADAIVATLDKIAGARGAHPSSIPGSAWRRSPSWPGRSWSRRCLRR